MARPADQAVVSRGTVNALFLIGVEFVARFPLEFKDPKATRARLESEAHAAREMLGRTRFLTPEPVALGEPGAGYPLPWSEQTWLPGTVATDEDPGESVAFAHDLAEFIRGVRAIETRGRTFSGKGGEVTFAPTTHGWRRVSRTVRGCWTFRDFAACGGTWGTFHTPPPGM